MKGRERSPADNFGADGGDGHRVKVAVPGEPGLSRFGAFRVFLISGNRMGDVMIVDIVDRPKIIEGGQADLNVAHELDFPAKLQPLQMREGTRALATSIHDLPGALGFC